MKYSSQIIFTRHRPSPPTLAGDRENPGVHLSIMQEHKFQEPLELSSIPPCTSCLPANWTQKSHAYSNPQGVLQF